MKELKLLKALWHTIWCGWGANVDVEHKGKANEWIPITKISCDKCGRVFYQKH